MKSRTLTRAVTQAECGWLPRDFKAGEILYVHEGPTYGGCRPGGVPMTEKPGRFPYLEFPEAALGTAVLLPPVVPLPWRCGAGREADCCIFLMAGADGFECGRGTRLDEDLRARRARMHAKRVPGDDVPYPDCMIFPDEAPDAGKAA